MKGLVAYLNFDGQTREAMTFYAKCLGAKLEIFSFGDQMGEGLPKEMEPVKDRTMHAALSMGAGAILMASDTMPGMPLTAGNNFSVSVHPESVEEVERLFAALGEGGTVRMPLTDAAWGARFGMLTDKFGIQWMFNYEYPKH
ncbi:MAG TPA: VOC family protein [Bryobacteraceae bacterium]|jgi:PhnB protein